METGLEEMKTEKDRRGTDERRNHNMLTCFILFIIFCYLTLLEMMDLETEFVCDTQ